MKKPSKELLKLCEIGRITEIKVDYIITGTDTAETFVKIIGDNGKVEGLWTTLSQYLYVRVDYNSLAEIKQHMKESVETWKTFEKKNAKELSEYERLKKKFGDI